MNAIPSLPEELQEEIRRLDELFWVDQSKLTEITVRFIEELEEAYESHVGVRLPTGEEMGTFLTLDLGGTNLRVCKVNLSPERGAHELVQAQYRIPSELKEGTAEELWEYIAESLQNFIGDHEWRGYDRDNPIPLGFTFSYPCTQEYIDHGVLQTWTKGFDINGVEGHDVAKQLRDAMIRRDLPVQLVALANDTVGAMVASAYTDPKTIIGAIFGTGCNAAYMENCHSITKVQSLPSDMSMAINCEYGAFDNEHQILPRTQYDETVDKESPRPGEQTFEKSSAGLYLGEIFRLVLVDLHTRGLIFKRQNTSLLNKGYSMDTALLSAIESDESPKLSKARDMLKETLGFTLTEPETELCRRLAELVAVRGARLCACGVAAICTKKGLKEGHVAADGSVVNKHPKFKKRWAKALGEILDWQEDREEDPIKLVSAEDGSGVGVAVIAGMTLESIYKDNMLGIKEGQRGNCRS